MLVMIFRRQRYDINLNHLLSQSAQKLSESAQVKRLFVSLRIIIVQTLIIRDVHIKGMVERKYR